jgi:hypothetical protein
MSRVATSAGTQSSRQLIVARSLIRRSVGYEADCRLGMGLRAMRINTMMTGAVIPGLIAGVIYFVIAFVTGASAAAAIIGGVVVAAIAIVIGLTFRAVFKRRAAPRPE